MASWMIHLRVAQQLYRQLNIESTNEFVLGNIAPDSGILSEDGTSYVPDKSVSHFYAWDSNGGKYIHEGLFIKQYFTPERRAIYTKEEDAFFLGYLTHLLTDKIWAREIVLPAKERQRQLYRSNPEQFWEIIKTHWYDLDFMYLKSNPSFEAFQIYRKIKNLKNTYMNIFPENAFEERRQFILDFYADGVANIEEHSTYLSKEELDVFVASAVNEIIAQISGYLVEESEVRHPQENIIKTYDYNGIIVDLVEWSDTVWCGKLGYADNNADEPDVEKIMEDFMSASVIPNHREDNWDICMSVNYLSCERPSGVMFGFLVATDDQPNSYDIYKIPTAQFLRMRMCDETARALGHEPWMGGIPPYHWLGEQIAPKLGYTYGSDTLPIIEYYGFFKPEEGIHEYCYLYVPVEENSTLAK